MLIKVVSSHQQNKIIVNLIKPDFLKENLERKTKVLRGGCLDNRKIPAVF